jgi:hypothetical protein
LHYNDIVCFQNARSIIQRTTSEATLEKVSFLVRAWLCACDHCMNLQIWQFFLFCVAATFPSESGSKITDYSCPDGGQSFNISFLDLEHFEIKKSVHLIGYFSLVIHKWVSTLHMYIQLFNGFNDERENFHNLLCGEFSLQQFELHAYCTEWKSADLLQVVNWLFTHYFDFILW